MLNAIHRSMKVHILNEDHETIGLVDLDPDEVDHFTSTSPVPARLCLSPDDISSLGIDEDDFVYVRNI